MPETFQDLRFPTKGVDQSHGYGMQPMGTTILGTNVRAYDPRTGRLRGGSRPGLKLFVGAQLPTGGVIQNLAAVVDVRSAALLDNLDPTNPQVDATDVSMIDPLFVNFLDPNPITPAATQLDPSGTRLVRVGGSGAQYGSAASRAVPTIAWADSAGVAPVTLGPAQLNATATDPSTFNPVPGAFVYTPPAGTVLSAGALQLLSVVFTPTDLSTYRVAGKTAHITVI